MKHGFQQLSLVSRLIEETLANCALQTTVHRISLCAFTLRAVHGVDLLALRWGQSCACFSSTLNILRAASHAC